MNVANEDDISHHGVSQARTDPKKHKDIALGDPDQLDRLSDPARSALTPYHAQGTMVTRGRTICNQEDFEARKMRIPPSDSGNRPSEHHQTRGEVPPMYAGQGPLSHRLAKGPPAVVLLGNAGAGKSTLLTQLGGKFESGAVFRKGFTKKISEQVVKVDGKDVCLIDVPGLFEPNDKETKFNALQLKDALSRGYKYRLYFVLRADNRGPDDKEMVMMSKIGECIGNFDGSQISFGVIVNQIRSNDVYDMYQQEMAHDNFQSMFRGLDMPGLTFDIKIDSVLMLWFDEHGLDEYRFRDELAKEIHKHPATAIELKKDIQFCNDDLKLYQIRHLTSALDVYPEHTPSGSRVHSNKPIRGESPQERHSQLSRIKKACHSNVSVNNKSKGFLESAKEFTGMFYGSSSQYNTGTSDYSSSRYTTGTSGVSSSHNFTEMSQCSSSGQNTEVPDDPQARGIMS